MRKYVILLLLSVVSIGARAQFNTDRLLTSGEIALHYEDYVLSIQYFNQVIALKPYLYQPWLYRGAAKFYLDDFTGAEADATQAIKLNPYIDGIYDLRAIARIRQKKYEQAITDYSEAIRISPANRNYWFNRAVCRMNVKDYQAAHHEVDTIVKRWAKFANAYSLNAELYLQEKDTVQAAKWLDKGLAVDPYDGDAWTTRAYISLARKQWRDADKFLSKALHIKPKAVNSYVNRALARFNYNNLRGAMSDYNMALDLDPNNFLAHYNRGLLRMQLGDDNRAIIDFDYVIKMEPGNVLAIFNRGILHDKTGNLRAAIRDYTAVIDQFPNFWTGLQYRARCYRRLGMTAQAERDEFRIFKAQMDKHVGLQNRWSQTKAKLLRKRSEIDPEKYNQIVVADENTIEHEYKSEYRGRVQNRSVETSPMPMYMLSYFKYANGVKSYQAFDREVETFNNTEKPARHLYVTCNPPQLNEVQTHAFFHSIDSLSALIDAQRSVDRAKPLLLQRAVAYSVMQNYDAAITDLTAYVQIDSTAAMAYYQRGVCLMMISEFNVSQGMNAQLQMARAMSDFDTAVKLNSKNAYIYFDRANLYIRQKNYGKAIDDYTTAIALNANLAEAYYNRGLARMQSGDKPGGVTDLSKAGELGLYSAYSIIKKSGSEK